MNTEWKKEYDRYISRLVQSDSGLDVTTLIYEFRQTPNIIAMFVRAAQGNKLLELEGTHVRITELGKQYAIELAREGATGSPLSWRDIPDEFKCPQLDPIEPYLPSKREVDKVILKGR